jgi:hypothetical protein
MNRSMNASEHFDAILRALPTPAVLIVATEKELEAFRGLATVLENVAFLEVKKRRDASKKVTG